MEPSSQEAASPGEDRDFSLLRDELREIAADGTLDVVDRSVRVSALVAQALEHLRVVPVLVGGTAVCFWTSDYAFTTRDIDLVMDEPPEADDVFRALGLALAPNGRHWALPGTEVFVELPSRALPPGAEAVTVQVAGGREVRVLSHVDVAIVRLEELAVGFHEDVAVQALALLSGIDDEARLRRRAAETGTSDLLDRLLPLALRVSRGEELLPAYDQLYRLVNGG